MVDYGLGSANGSGGGGGRGDRKGHGEIEVQWGRERLRISLPPPTSPLSTLKSELYKITGVPPDHQKLIYSGAVLKDDLASLQTYDLTDPLPTSSTSSTTSFWDNWSFTGKSDKNRKLKRLVMLGDKDVARVLDRKVPVEEAKVVKEVDKEEVVVEKIKEIVDNSVKEWEPKIGELEEWLKVKKGEVVQGEGETKVEEPNPRTPIWLSEVLLQSLLKLDSFDIPSDYTEARKERKAAVKTLQAALDRVDAYTSAAKL